MSLVDCLIMLRTLQKTLAIGVFFLAAFTKNAAIDTL